MGTLSGGGVGQGLTQGQLGTTDVGAFNPIAQGTGPVAVGERNRAAQNLNPQAAAAGATDQDQTGIQQGFGGDASGGDVTGGGGTVDIDNA